MKQIKKLKENEVILCRTQEECEAIAELLHKEGQKWNDGKSYLESRPWEVHKSIYFYFHVLDNTFMDYQRMLPKNYTIHNAQDFLPPQQDPIKQAIIEMIKEWHDSKFQKPLINILRARL